MNDNGILLGGWKRPSPRPGEGAQWIERAHGNGSDSIIVSLATFPNTADIARARIHLALLEGSRSYAYDFQITSQGLLSFSDSYGYADPPKPENWVTFPLVTAGTWKITATFDGNPLDTAVVEGFIHAISGSSITDTEFITGLTVPAGKTCTNLFLEIAQDWQPAGAQALNSGSYFAAKPVDTGTEYPLGIFVREESYDVSIPEGVDIHGLVRLRSWATIGTEKSGDLLLVEAPEARPHEQIDLIVTPWSFSLGASSILSAVQSSQAGEGGPTIPFGRVDQSLFTLPALSDFRSDSLVFRLHGQSLGDWDFVEVWT